MLEGLGPVVDSGCRVLVLGSMPGEASLRAGQYYAHPRNRFWPFMAQVLGEQLPIAYADRLSMLKRNRVALWDVAQSCRRQGSLDSAIRDVVPNDFAAFFQTYPRINAVFLNGNTAHALFIRFCGDLAAERSIVRLPSTSPANNSISHIKQLQEWRAVAAASKGDFII